MRAPLTTGDREAARMTTEPAPGEPGEVTRLLHAIAGGDAAASERLVPLVYEELRSVAAAHLRSEDVGHTLQPTALVHEAYLRLVGQQTAMVGRAHFFALAAQAMRRVLVDHARRRNAQRRGGGRRVTLQDDHAVTDEEPIDLLALDAGLEKLARDHERPARTVELRYFGGLSMSQIADVLGVSKVTVKRDWSFARAWLYRELADER